MKKAVVTITSDAFVNNRMTSTMIKSFAFNNPSYDGDFIILYSKEKGESLTAKGKKDLQLQLVNLKNVIYKQVKTSKYNKIWDKWKSHENPESPFIFNKLVFYKFEVFNLPEYDAALFLDGDVVVTANILDLFNHTDKVIFTPDVLIGEQEYVASCAKNYMGYKHNNYINAGVFLVGKNLQGLCDQLISYAEDVFQIDLHPRLMNTGWFPEQDVMNKFFDNSWEAFILPASYNFLPRKVDSISMQNLADLKVIHYMGVHRPNKLDMIKNPIYRYIMGMWFLYNSLQMHAEEE